MIRPLPPAGCWSAYASPNVTEGTFFAEQMVAYGEACAAAERERIKDALLEMHRKANCRHNYFACAVVELFGPNV